MSKNISRHDFLKGTALGAAGVAAGACVPMAAPALAETESGMNAEKYLGKWDFEIPPAPIPDSDIAETIEAEVIVVGAGTAGLVAANSAMDEGLDVILISASSMPIYRGGSNHAVMSKCKERLGLPIDDELLFQREMLNNGMNIDERKWYNFYNHSEEAMNWLIDIMEDKGYSVGLEQANQFLDDGLYFSIPGAHGFMTEDRHSMGMNQDMVVNELAARLEEGTDKPVYYKNIARQLVREDNNTGRVTAVIAEREDGSYAKYVGTKAIILATGDFSSNRDMMYKYAPYTAEIISDAVFDAEPDYDKCFVYGGLYPGDGQRMGLWVGAAWQKVFPCCPMGGAVGAGPGNRSMLYTGLRIDRNGERFMNEYGFRDMGGYVNRLQPGGVVYAIWDAGHAAKYAERVVPWINTGVPLGEDCTRDPELVLQDWMNGAESGTYFKADTIEELVEKMGLPASTVDTVARYNELCHKGVDEDFHKDPRLLIPIEDGPFFGQMGNRTVILCVLGGLRTTPNMQVCDENDDPIPGLYNVGTMVGDMFNVNYTFEIPGFNLGATCVTFGYMVGKYIAANE
ncbi:MAG: FAD-binding protein [Coriobacteriales bacterium]|nr:FAD-binding protein [Coriobacteriales bacterium]